MLYEDTWSDHILGGGHPDMSGHELDVQATLEDPEFVYEDHLDPDTSIYLSDPIGVSFWTGSRYFVAVDFATTTGVVATAQHFGRKVRGKLVYQRKKK